MATKSSKCEHCCKRVSQIAGISDSIFGYSVRCRHEGHQPITALILLQNERHLAPRSLSLFRTLRTWLAYLFTGVSTLPLIKRYLISIGRRRDVRFIGITRSISDDAAKHQRPLISFDVSVDACKESTKSFVTLRGAYAHTHAHASTWQGTFVRART